MEAKDTVMSDEERKKFLPINDGYSYYKGYGEAISQAQAEISFKAGIREVVEWLQKTSDNLDYNNTISLFAVGMGEWEAKLKEWGINLH